MFPSTAFSLFPPYPRTNQAFVAMSFAPTYDSRWRNVIEPALRAVLVEGIPLQPHRVDLSVKSDAILTEILRSISDCRVVFADITAIRGVDDRPVRNGNVMYEIGIAHAVRLPEEVVLFRSDDLALDFDVAGVRVHRYDPDGDPEAAAAKVVEVVSKSLLELSAQRRVSVDSACRRLTGPSIDLLLTANASGGLEEPPLNLANMERLRAVSLLLDLGGLRTELGVYPIGSEQDPQNIRFDLATYRITPFGQALLQAVQTDLGIALNRFADENPSLVSSASPGTTA